MYYLKGCVQGYGSYDKLTTSGSNPKELFDDIEDNELKSTDVIIEESYDAIEESSQRDTKSLDHIQLLPMEKTRFVTLPHSENDTSTFNEALDTGSLYTTPSMFSLISMPTDFEYNMKTNMVS